jgi:uncharacterized membrane-anchored protein
MHADKRGGNTMSANQENMKFMLSKVPEVTIYFWIIKVLCTTVGETFADFINVNLGLGLTTTTLMMGVAFIIFLFLQLRATKYVPGIYWMTVVFISVFGTLVTDNMTDGMGVPLETSTIVFSVLLALTFLLWYMSEKTLSIHSIFTRKREIYYWLTILFTFALGTAVGDLYSEQLGLGYLKTGIIVAVTIACMFVAWKLKLNEILAFWIAYILTRPLGASLGDYLSQSKVNGGLDLGTTVTSVIFLAAILVIIVFLGVTKYDIINKTEAAEVIPSKGNPRQVWTQTVAVLAVFLVVGIGGYVWCSNNTVPQIAASQTTLSGQLSDFVQLESDMESDIAANDFSSANSKADQLEHDWDKAEPKLRKIDRKTWTKIDGTIDDVLAAVRSKNPSTSKSKSILDESLSVIQNANQ